MTKLKWGAKHFIFSRMTHLSKKLHHKTEKSQCQTICCKALAIIECYGPYIWWTSYCDEQVTVFGTSVISASTGCCSTRATVRQGIWMNWSFFLCTVMWKNQTYVLICVELRLLGRQYFWLSGQVKIALFVSDCLLVPDLCLGYGGCISTLPCSVFLVHYGKS